MNDRDYCYPPDFVVLRNKLNLRDLPELEAAERDVLVVSDEKYGAMTVGGNYTKVAEGLGVQAERVETPDAFVPALERGIAVTDGGAPFLIECIVKEGQTFSRY